VQPTGPTRRIWVKEIPMKNLLRAMLALSLLSAPVFADDAKKDDAKADKKDAKADKKDTKADKKDTKADKKDTKADKDKKDTKADKKP
jgi:hypothetical protein